MIHTVYIDDSTRKGKDILKELQKETKVVRFDNPIEKGILPEGYKTSADFRIAVKQGLKAKLKSNGYL
jgi:hypothetical protein